MSSALPSRLAPARRRADVAKTGLAATGLILFAAAMVLARVQAPGHTRHAPQALTAPPSFVKAVRQNLLQAGLIAPAQDAPSIATSVS